MVILGAAHASYIVWRAIFSRVTLDYCAHNFSTLTIANSAGRLGVLQALTILINSAACLTVWNDTNSPSPPNISLKLVCSITEYTDLTMAFFTFKFHTVSWYTRIYDLIYARKEGTAFLMPISTKWQLPNWITRRSLVMSFTQLGQYLWKVGIQSRWRP